MKPIPQFAQFFDAAAPLPGARDADFKGYVLGLQDTLYHAWPGINSSTLKERTACEMLYTMREDDVDPYVTTAGKIEDFTVGKLLHWAVLEPWRFDNPDDHMVQCETKGLATITAADQRKNNPTKLLVSAEHVELAAQARKAIMANPEAMRLLESDEIMGSNEVSGFVFDPEMLIWRKWRVDRGAANANFMIDVKTTRRHVSDFKKDCRDFGYLFQSAWYMDSHELLTRQRIGNFYWIVVNKSEPFMCRVVCQENLDRDNPIYSESSLAYHRERLGLDVRPETPMIGRLPTFVNSASETAEFQKRGVKITPELLRATWPAYEQETPIWMIY